MNKTSFVRFLAICLALGGDVVKASDGSAVMKTVGADTLLQVQGNANDDWHLQTSTNLTTWTTATNFGTLLSGGTNAPWRSVGPHVTPQTYFRAIQTAGFYDTSLLRVISLTFTQANWSNQMVLGRQYGTNAYCSLLTMNNGATNMPIGARFRGNTSFTGGPGAVPPVKKSINLTIDHAITNADLMGFESLNLNNAYMDETIMRESVYFNIMRQYTVCPACSMVQLYINGANRGVFSCPQQQDGNLIGDYFPSKSGDRFRAGNMDASAAFNYLGNTNIATYTPHYELKHTEVATNVAWARLIRAISNFNGLAAATLRDTAEDVIAVDRWLWFCALENVFADDDSYWNKGSDYMLYFEPESGRVHPVEHDGNEAFVAGDAALSPLAGTNRIILNRLLGNAELRQRYFAHMRTVLQEWFNPTNAIALVSHFQNVSAGAIAADPYRGYTAMTTYTNDLNALRSFITNRWRFLTITNAYLKPLPPVISAVYAPTSAPSATQIPYITAAVAAQGAANGLGSVWLYFRGANYGKFTYRQMFDDGAHADGAAGDGIFGAVTTNYPAATKVRYYVEARATNSAKASAFSPPRAEQETYNYRVALTSASNSPVIINEIMADNDSAFPDPQGEYDDWIELFNVTDAEVDLTGRYLSDEPANPRKWQFPAGTKIPANGYLIVWADENGTATPGLHASFKLSKSGEELFLVDTDASLNVILDRTSFGAQQTDRAYGRWSADPDVWMIMDGTPGLPNL